LVGENGAGKSTLMKVLSGVYPEGSFAGDILVNDEFAHFRNIRDSESAGIGIIFQELSLVKELTVAENIFLGELSGVISWSTLRRRASELIASLGFDIDPSLRTGALTVAHQQVVEIAKALSRQVKIIVFDEPTAVLSTQDAERLHKIIAVLRTQGVGIVYISHRLDEVFRISDRMTVPTTWPDFASMAVMSCEP